MGLRGWRVDSLDTLEQATADFLAHPGPALLDVRVNRHELVVPPHVEPTQVFGTMLYGIKAVLDGRGTDVAEMVDSNLRR
jgi:pyruvate dehydrogenase (quinone)